MLAQGRSGAVGIGTAHGRVHPHADQPFHCALAHLLDDLGVEKPSERIIKQYYNIIDRRLNNLLPTIFTSNFSIEKIGNNLGDRIASRLEMAIEIKFPKKDLRKELIL